MSPESENRRRPRTRASLPTRRVGVQPFRPSRQPPPGFQHPRQSQTQASVRHFHSEPFIRQQPSFSRSFSEVTPRKAQFPSRPALVNRRLMSPQEAHVKSPPSRSGTSPRSGASRERSFLPTRNVHRALPQETSSSPLRATLILAFPTGCGMGRLLKIHPLWGPHSPTKREENAHVHNSPPKVRACYRTEDATKHPQPGHRPASGSASWKPPPPSQRSTTPALTFKLIQHGAGLRCACVALGAWGSWVRGGGRQEKWELRGVW